MKSLSCLVIGYGSIGKRHTEVLRNLNYRVFVVSRRKIDYEFTFASIDEALSQSSPDYVIIANETSSHLITLEQLMINNYKGKILIEKPLFSEVPPRQFTDTKNIFVGYNLRFHPLLKLLKERLKTENIISAQIYVGQYLPDWRPNSDYSKSYSANHSLGGGVLRDLSHEIDYVLWILGLPTELTAIGGKFSSLNIDSDDVFALFLKTKLCPVVTIQVNYLDRIIKREIIINTNDNSFHLDLIKGTLQTKDELIPLEIERNFIYKEMHKSIINDSQSDCCTYDEGLNVLKIIQSAELASNESKWVSL